MVGLIAKESVIVCDNEENRSDCEIHASIMALEESFTAQNYQYGSPRGELTVVGGIIQRYRGPVGTFSYYGIRSGYIKDYHYDERFQDETPPSFPREKPKVLSWRDNLSNIEE